MQSRKAALQINKELHQRNTHILHKESVSRTNAYKNNGEYMFGNCYIGNKESRVNASKRFIVQQKAAKM